MVARAAVEGVVDTARSQPLAALLSQFAQPVLHVPMPQAPLVQTGVAFASAQVRPQAPQFAVVLVMLVSQPLAGSPSQLPKPAVQAATAHAPCVQVAVALARAQAVPQAPQRLTVVSRFTSQPLERVPSQLPKPRLQVIAQAPAVQVVGAALAVWRTHETPQPPQFERSVWGSTQVLLQTARGAVQTSRHEPAKQMAFDAQVRPQAPQFARLLVRLTSQPSVALLLQSAKPVLQVPRAQALLAQVAAALAKAHTRPQAPQWRTSVTVFTSQPLAALPSQLPKPMLHAMPQAPAVHEGEALARVGHWVPQAPQFAALVLVFTSQPFIAMPSQLAVPAGQTTEQAPAWQRAVAPPRRVQALPQVMQFAVSEVRFASQPLAALRSQSPKPVLQLATPQVAMVQLAVPLAAVQRRPQAPQFAASDCGFTQAPPQHDSPMPQRRPQAPQLFASVSVLAQVAVQQVCPAPQGRVMEQPGTQEFIVQMEPGPQSLSSRQFTHMRDPVSQRAPPEQSMSLRQPGTHWLALQ
ncbi:MAG: hypothetical protein U0325_19575 [Polyangiales bacterium]